MKSYLRLIFVLVSLLVVQAPNAFCEGSLMPDQQGLTMPNAGSDGSEDDMMDKAPVEMGELIPGKVTIFKPSPEPTVDLVAMPDGTIVPVITLPADPLDPDVGTEKIDTVATYQPDTFMSPDLKPVDKDGNPVTGTVVIKDGIDLQSGVAIDDKSSGPDSDGDGRPNDADSNPWNPMIWGEGDASSVTTPVSPVNNADGSVTTTDGSVVKPDGTVILPDETIVKPDGTVRQPDGTIVKP